MGFCSLQWTTNSR